MSNLAKKIEGLLFFESDAIALSDLISLTSSNEEDVKTAINEIDDHYKGEGKDIILLSANDNYQMVVSGETKDIITARENKEREGEISKAGLETLSTILYLGSATKNQVDYIRGVQSGYMIRVLASRGLIARSNKIGRDTIYVPTVETLRFLGINNVEELPEYVETSKTLKEALSTQEE